MKQTIEQLRHQTERVIAALTSGADPDRIAALVAEREKHVLGVIEAMKRGTLVAQDDVEVLQSLERRAIELLRANRDARYAALAASRKGRTGSRAYRKATDGQPAVHLDRAG